uniref:DUF6534 domain-containing protein n=1 Tax=Mycena chlorophos TaxID=658473 RepID=A0ABQ0M4M5_MYCCL|nr:predicted protein [Mycena chlorophos]
MSNSATAALASQPVDYEYSVPGAILLDGLLHSFCIGFVLAEGLKYWGEYEDDRPAKRGYVAVVVLLSLIQTVLQDYKVWTVAVFQKPWAGNPFMWTDLFLAGVICSMCELFYIRRCWKMTGCSRFVLYPLALLWFGSLIAHMYITITLSLEFKFFTVGHIFNQGVERLFRSTVIAFSYWLVGCAVLDISVAAILITNLFRSKTGLDKSDSVVNRVILMTLETALLPSMSMLIAVIILHAAPNPGQHDDLVLFFVFITAKLYAIGLLRTLNARRRLRQRLDSTDIGRTSLAKWTWDQEHHPNAAELRPARGLQLVMELENASTTVRGSVESLGAAQRYEGVAPDEIRVEERSIGGSQSRLRVLGSEKDEEHI